MIGNKKGWYDKEMANSKEYRLSVMFAFLININLPLLMAKTTGIYRTFFAFLFLISGTIYGTIMIKKLYKRRKEKKKKK